MVGPHEGPRDKTKEHLVVEAEVALLASGLKCVSRYLEAGMYEKAEQLVELLERAVA